MAKKKAPQKTRTDDRTSEHYVDNKKFYEALVEFKKDVLLAKKNGKERPRIPEYVGECLLKIAQHLATMSKFSNYTYIEDMIGDSVINCILYIDNFNPDEYNNPFAYFTQIIYYAFVRKINVETKQTYTKYKVIENNAVFDLLDHNDGVSHVVDNGNIDASHITDFVQRFESKEQEKKLKRKKMQKKVTIESFMAAN